MSQISINLDSQVIEELKALIVELASRGEIRSTEDGRYSVFDVIRNAGEKKGERGVWKRLTLSNSEIVLDCYNYRFPGQRGAETPVATLDTCIYIINLLPGDIGEKMRRLSAIVTAQVVQQVNEDKPSISATSDTSMAQVLAVVQSQSQQTMAMMMQMQQENNRQIQAILGTLTQIVANQSQSQVKPKPQLEAVKDSISSPTHQQLIDDVIDEQVACNYNKMWVKHSLVHHSRASHLTKNDWLYCAMKLGYKPGWAYHCYNETRHGKKAS